jgi:hypothetical protein
MKAIISEVSNSAIRRLVVGGDAGLGAAVDLGLHHPFAKTFSAHTELAGNSGDYSVPDPALLLDRFEGHANGPVLKLC